MSKDKVRLSPLVRLRMSFGKELNIDKGTVLGWDTYEKYLEMQREAELKQHRLVKSLFAQDAALFLLMSGKSWSVSSVVLDVSSIPAIQEILLFSSSLTFLFLCSYFVTNQCYSAVIDEFGNRIVNSDKVDPDFFNASRKHFDFFLKIFRPKMNIWGVDFYQHGKGFAFFSGFIMAIIIFAILTIPAAHVLLASTALGTLHNSDLGQFTKWFLSIVVAVLNLGGFLMVFGMMKDFTFTIATTKEES